MTYPTPNQQTPADYAAPFMADLQTRAPQWCAEVAAAYGLKDWAALTAATTAQGWSVEDSGGGCMIVISAPAEDDTPAPVIVITDGETGLPAPGERYLIGAYRDRDGLLNGDEVQYLYVQPARHLCYFHNYRTDNQHTIRPTEGETAQQAAQRVATENGHGPLVWEPVPYADGTANGEYMRAETPAGAYALAWIEESEEE